MGPHRVLRTIQRADDLADRLDTGNVREQGTDIRVAGPDLELLIQESGSKDLVGAVTDPASGLLGGGN